ncbi:hypothetical protein OF83DRAFT_182069 [Amylostereum chailletii]|nr:hypothetical protein OF83DRAFT_182069 [Amylostereum chailletii]
MACGPYWSSLNVRRSPFGLRYSNVNPGLARRRTTLWLDGSINPHRMPPLHQSVVSGTSTGAGGVVLGRARPRSARTHTWHTDDRTTHRVRGHRMAVIRRGEQTPQVRGRHPLRIRGSPVLGRLHGDEHPVLVEDGGPHADVVGDVDVGHRLAEVHVVQLHRHTAWDRPSATTRTGSQRESRPRTVLYCRLGSACYGKASWCWAWRVSEHRWNKARTR